MSFEGVGSLWATQPDGSDLTRCTDHRDYYARHVRTDRRCVVSHAGEDLYDYDAAECRTRQLLVDLERDRT